jgi:hypothetical protein
MGKYKLRMVKKKVQMRIFKPKRGSNRRIEKITY